MRCSFGEFTCGPALTTSRGQQHDVVTDLATLWLDHHLRNDAAALTAFADSMLTTPRAVTRYDCFSTGLGEDVAAALRMWPMPCHRCCAIGRRTAHRHAPRGGCAGCRTPVHIERGTPTLLHVAALAPVPIGCW
ncbi:MAG: hypothetical protein IPG74_15430 [Flavobacteriales bacterium]|nr:hypothetical protein [Flavobacteriales bacterium]